MLTIAQSVLRIHEHKWYVATNTKFNCKICVTCCLSVTDTSTDTVLHVRLSFVCCENVNIKVMVSK